MPNNFNAFRAIIFNPIKFKIFLLTRLPMGFLAGLKVTELTEQNAVVLVQYKWLNQNPFNSIYFAVLSMAAELSTGILPFGFIYKQTPVSMLVIKNEGNFYKKAIGKISFICNDGAAIQQAIEQTIKTKEGVNINCTSVGINEKGEEVARFIFTWSFKAK